MAGECLHREDGTPSLDPTALRLIGVGVGPGDPELITMAAVRVLAEADVILVPSTEASGDRAGRAEQIVLAACPQAAGAIRRVPFSMADPVGVTGRRRAAWEASAQAALSAYDEGARVVALATVGDPSVYSTFSYLAATVRARRPQVSVQVVPGITAMQALAAATCTPLVEGTETLTLVPVTAGLDVLARALDGSDTVVAYKGGRRMSQVVELLRERGRAAVLGTDVSLSDQRLFTLAERVGGGGSAYEEASGVRGAAYERYDEGEAPYFATVLSVPARTGVGGRL